VSLWDRITGKPASVAATRPPDASADSARSSDATNLAFARLRQLGAPDGPTGDEALALFRALRATPDEARAIDAVRSAGATRAIPDAIRVAAAAALAERGELDEALVLVSGGGVGGGLGASPEARLLAADLHAERGEIPEALALIERVLLVDLDYPGARERHARWRIQLGLDANAAPRADASAVTIVSREPDAPFALLREVARGGSGAVYEAEDRELGRRVALKVYHHPERDRAQLLHEARVAASLTGSGVVRVLDVDPEHGWIALEWAPLGSLRQNLRGKDARGQAVRSSPLAQLVPLSRWAIPVAAAIARVHAAGWVHHDIKPANVLLATPERPILADFGTARRAGEPSPPGSLGYVSPERLAGRASDPRDDVFGFGRILEDALSALAAQQLLPTAAHANAWREIASACTGPDAGRPNDARALLTRLRVEAAEEPRP
jgi:tRNA A-37 threonylcarbamoyl transferase component Bud32